MGWLNKDGGGRRKPQCIYKSLKKSLLKNASFNQSETTLNFNRADSSMAKYDNLQM